MVDFIIALIVAVIVVSAIIYIVKQKKRGVKCIGCSASGCCEKSKSENSSCSCGCHNNEE